MALPNDLGLDYSIELYGVTLAWELFRFRLSGFGVFLGSLTESQCWGIRAIWLNGDIRGYLTRLVDARLMTESQAIAFAKGTGNPGKDKAAAPKQEAVFKWVPGDHYYAAGSKFNSLAEAEAALARKGIKSLGLRERWIYNSGSE